VIFGYNGRDGVVTDSNGLIYMRARYYSPDMKRFINADIIPGKLSNAITLNRFAYANGNPVSFTDPLGLSVLDWVNGITKAVVIATVVVAAVAVIAGTGGTAAPVVLGISASAAVGGHFNEKAGGNYFSGAVGGAVSGGIQLAGTAIGGPVGTAIGGSLGSGVGTAVTETLDNLLSPEENSKNSAEILNDSLKSAGVALLTSSVTGAVNAMTLDTSVANSLMPGGWSSVDNNVFGAVMGAVDDASTYIILSSKDNTTTGAISRK
jgi:RHS repeat-associated protein